MTATPTHGGGGSPAAPTRRDELRALIGVQIALLERDLRGWNGGLVRDLCDVDELVVGLEMLADELRTASPPRPSAAFAVLGDVALELDAPAATIAALRELAARYSVLELASGRRAGGSHQTPRDYRDLVIDGVGLGGRVGDVIPVFGWFDPASQRTTIDELAGRRPGSLPGGRVALCVCPECGDLGCGALSAQVALDDDAAHWRELGWQSDYEARHSPVVLGPFRFERGPYLAVLGELRAGLAGRRR